MRRSNHENIDVLMLIGLVTGEEGGEGGEGKSHSKVGTRWVRQICTVSTQSFQAFTCFKDRKFKMHLLLKTRVDFRFLDCIHNITADKKQLGGPRQLHAFRID